MAKLSKDFFTDNEVLFVGYSLKNNAFSKGVYDAFAKNGIKVYPLNKNAEGSHEVKVYKSLTDLPKVPRCAYILLNRDNTGNMVKLLAENGVTRILFQNKKNGDTDILTQCKDLGMDTAVACPMMVLGSGIHRLHGFFAGVR